MNFLPVVAEEIPIQNRPTGISLAKTGKNFV